MNDFRIITPANRDQWDRYVAEHPKATIFHTREMVEVYRATNRYQPLAIAAVNGSGKPIAMLVSVLVQTLPSPASRFASRAIMFAEPICDDNDEGIEGLSLLLRKHDSQMQRRALFAEIRPIREAGAEQVALQRCGYEHLDYLNYVADIGRPVDEVWQSVRRGCRKVIERTRRKGIELVEDYGETGVTTLYTLLQGVYHRSRVPLADVSLFQAALRHLTRDQYRLTIANYRGQAVAASLDLVHKGLVYYWYGGSKRVPGVYAHDVVMWDVMEWAANSGHKVYDFGGAGWPGEDYGPGQFKAKFGGELVRYGRYRKTFSSWRLWLAETAYRRVRGILAPNSSSD